MVQLRKRLLGLVFGLVLLCGLVSASLDGAAVTSIANSRYTPNVAQTQNVVAGTIYDVNLNAASSTNYWSAVWGNVSGAVELRNSAGYQFVSWNVPSGAPAENPVQNIYTGVIAFNSSTAPKVSTFGYMAGSQFDSVMGINSVLADSAQNLFTSSSTTVILGNKTVTGGIANQAFCPVTYNATSGNKNFNDCGFPTMVANDSNGNLAFLTGARPIVWTGGGSIKLFDNASFANYEMLLFSNNSGTAAATTYYFYLELR